MPTFALLALALLALGACTPFGAAVSAGAKAGTTVAQERSIGEAIDDTRIDAAIQYQWARHDLALFRKVTTSVVEGRVLLTGSVRYPRTRVEAVRLAWQAEGVREVINEIQVEDESGLLDQARDLWILAELRSRLLFDAEIKSVNYSLDCVNGTIYLMGIAQDQAELDRVQRQARDIAGVRNVVNHVRLKSDPRRPAS